MAATVRSLRCSRHSHGLDQCEIPVEVLAVAATRAAWTLAPRTEWHTAHTVEQVRNLAMHVEEQLRPLARSQYDSLASRQLDSVAIWLSVKRVPIQAVLGEMMGADVGADTCAIVLAVLKDVKQTVPVASFVGPDLRISAQHTVLVRLYHAVCANVGDLIGLDFL